MTECERRGCDDFATHQLTIDAPPIPKRETTTFNVCYWHSRVASEEFVEASNILEAKQVSEDV